MNISAKQPEKMLKDKGYPRLKVRLRMDEDEMPMPKTCEGCVNIQTCDPYSLGTHQACYDKMDEDDKQKRKEGGRVPKVPKPPKGLGLT